MSKQDVTAGKVVLALADMYSQYCSGRFGHDFMSAGENACEVLREYGLIKADDELDEVAVMKLEQRLPTQSKDSEEK